MNKDEVCNKLKCPRPCYKTQQTCPAWLGYVTMDTALRRERATCPPVSLSEASHQASSLKSLHPLCNRRAQRTPVSLSEASQQASSLKSLHPLCSKRKTQNAKHKTDNSKEQNQSGTSKDEQTAPCKTLHPKHLKRHKNPITQVYLKLETILISRKYHLSKQTQRQLTQIYLNGDDNHE